jgi:hypothetical protein
MAQQQMGLFGPTPNELLQAQQAADQALALRQSQFAPGQGLMYQAASAGQRAGRSLAGLFGIEDPALSEAKKMEELKAAVASQWDGNDPLEAYKIFAKEASARGLTQAALGAATQIKAFEADRSKTELGKRKVEAELDLVGAQTEAAKKATERATAQEERTAQEFDYRKSQRALDEAIKEVNLTAARKSNESKQIQYDAAKLALDKAKAEFEAIPEGFYKRQYELKLEKLEADIKAAKALATYRERERAPEGKRKMAEIPIRDDIGTVVGKTIVYSDGTRETVYGNAAPSSEDTASQAARGMTPGSNILEQLKQPLLEERRRRDQERKNQPGAR